MTQILAADEFGSGVGGLLVTVLLGIVSIGLFIAMSGSLKRMRANVETGTFAEPSGRGGRDAEPRPADVRPADTASVAEPTTTTAVSPSTRTPTSAPAPRASTDGDDPTSS